MPTIPDPRANARYYFKRPPIYALAVDEPWWWANLALGADLINVHWNCDGRGPLAIVSRAQKPWHRNRDIEAIRAILKAENRPQFDAYSCPKADGKIVGLVNVIDCHGDADAEGHWFVGPYALEIEKPCMLPFRYAPSLRVDQGLIPIAEEKQGCIRYALTALANGADPGGSER
jgi:hypothetical protein